MLGRVRSASSSPDSLLHTSKLLKHDSLSIYESTLIKLKLGSQRSLHDDSMETQTDCSHPNLVHESVHEEPITSDTDCSSLTSHSLLPTQSQTKHHCTNNFSVIYMFSKYNNSRNGLVSSSEETMTEAEDNGFASPCSSCTECLSDDATKQRCQHQSFSPSSVSSL